MKNALLTAYRTLRGNGEHQPQWAVHKKAAGHTDELIDCTVPFVGNLYARQKKKILLYASAENLSNYNGYLDDSSVADDRHRIWFERSKDTDYFPNVHLQPITDGGLLLAAYYICTHIRAEKCAGKCLPCEFEETIAFGNYCKYTIEGGRNRDYAQDTKKLAYSRPYVSRDLEILKPDAVILPKTIYEKEYDFLKKYASDTVFYPIYQINSQTVNLWIAPHYAPADMDGLDVNVNGWYAHLHGGGIEGKTKENFRSVFTYLDSVISEIQG